MEISFLSFFVLLLCFSYFFNKERDKTSSVLHLAHLIRYPLFHFKNTFLVSKTKQSNEVGKAEECTYVGKLLLQSHS